MNVKLIPIKNGYSIRVRMQIDGVPYRRQEKFIGNKRDALNRGDEIRKELEKQAKASKDEKILITFSDCVRVYRNRTPADKRTEGRVKRLERELGHVHLNKLQEELVSFLAYLSQCRTPKGTFYKPATINRYREVCLSIIKCSIEWGFLKESPIRQLPKKFKEHPRDQSLTPEQEELLLKTIKKESPHIYHIVQFALIIPSRKGELVRMKRDDVDLINNTIRIKNGTTKNSQGVTKPIPPQMREYFENIPEKSTYVFYREVAGKYRSLGDFKTAWNNCKRKSGIEDFRFHDTRHIAATRLIQMGIPEREVMDIAGWKTNMLSTYYHRSSERSAQSVLKILGNIDNSSNQ